jgi:type IX secretion system PorP/SprF family membrane protein
MKKTLTYLLMIFAGLANAQQLPQYTQYMLNQMAINPAVAGKDEFAEVRSNNRHQWLGIQDAPRTYMLTLHGPLIKKMGLGMNLFTDITGPTRRTGLSFAYAYHLQVKEDQFLSMGLSAGLLQWGLDGNKITLRDPGDGQLITNYQTIMLPDFGFGLYYEKKNHFYAGISMPQINQSQIPLYPGAYKNSRLVAHFNVNGGYTFDLKNKFKIEPSFLLKYESPAPLKLDIGLRGIYNDFLWLGGVYRTQDAFSVLLGYIYENYLLVGYSYDITTTKLKQYSGGTHELMLGLRFSRKQASTWKGRKLSGSADPEQPKENPK